MRHQAESFTGAVAPAKDSATVVLLRPGESGPEVFLMRRRPTMAFAAGMHVFPGGGVEESDSDPGTPWLGPDPERWAMAFGCPPELARALIVAAVRETFEETGVLLAGPDAESVVTTPADVVALRAEVEAGRQSFSELLHERSLFLRADLLAPWAHWITPVFAPRRYDTRFFVGMLPDGQSLGELSSEADDAAWLPLKEAIDGARSGGVTMMAPTVHVCRQLDAAPIDTLLDDAWRREIPTVAPRVVEIDGELFYDHPPESEF